MVDISDITRQLQTKITGYYHTIVHPVLLSLLYFIGLFLANHAVFWGIEQLHYQWCATGFLQSIFTNQSGLCTVLRTISSSASSASSNVLQVLASLVVTKILMTRTPNQVTTDKEKDDNNNVNKKESTDNSNNE